MSPEVATILYSPLAEGEEVEFQTKPKRAKLPLLTPFVPPTLPTLDSFTVGFLGKEPQRRELALASADSTELRLR